MDGSQPTHPSSPTPLPSSMQHSMPVIIVLCSNVVKIYLNLVTKRTEDDTEGMGTGRHIRQTDIAYGNRATPPKNVGVLF